MQACTVSCVFASGPFRARYLVLSLLHGCIELDYTPPRAVGPVQPVRVLSLDFYDCVHSISIGISYAVCTQPQHTRTTTGWVCCGLSDRLTQQSSSQHLRPTCGYVRAGWLQR